MRSGIWRGATLAMALALAATADRAEAMGLFSHTIPRETLAMDYRTGDVMMAPPIPYGEYAKDYAGAVHGAAGMTFGAVHGLASKVKGLCGKCGGGLCGQCGGKGHHNGKACGGCGGDGCPKCGSGLGGLFHHGEGGEAYDPSLGMVPEGGYRHAGLFHHDGGTVIADGGTVIVDGASGLGHHHGAGVSCVGPGCTTGYASSQAVLSIPAKGGASPQAFASTQLDPVCGGCLGIGRLKSGEGCGLCGGCGRLKGLLHHGNGSGLGSLCGACGGKGCGGCGGKGFLSGLCGICKGAGCGACRGGNGQGLCRNCGGAGCGLCGKLRGKAHGLLGLPAGLCAKITHKGQIKYFVGAGGPVPLTPGYVPYVVSTRSPRDYFAFPPFSDQIP